MKPFIQDEIEFTGKYSKQVFQTIYLAVRQYKNKFIFCFLCGFFGRFFLLLNTNILGLWADNLCHGTSYCQKKSAYFATLSSNDFIHFLLITTSLGFLFLLAFRIWIARLGTYSSSFLYDETTYRVSRYPMSFFDKTPVGRMITRFTSDYAAIIRMTGGPFGEFVSITIDLFLFCILTLMTSIYYLPVLLIALGLNYFVYYLNKSKIRQNRRNFSVSRGPVLSHFAESVQGSKIIRVFGKEKIFTNVFLKKFDQYVAQKNKTNIANSFFSLQMSFLNGFMLIITAVFGLYLASIGLVSLGSIGVAFTFISMASMTILMFFEWTPSIEDALTGLERFSDYLHKPLEPGAQNRIKVSSLDHKIEILPNENSSLKIENLSLKYFEHSPLILKNISFNVEKGEKIGLVGKTGSGKSSIIQSIFYLYPFTTGSIKIDDKSVLLNKYDSSEQENYLSLEKYRSYLALITQDPCLFMGTLRENLVGSKLKIFDEQLIHVLEAVGLKKLLFLYKNPLDLEVLEKGKNFSLGERQLVCMARTLIQNAPIVLMDEATSSVDPYTEEMLTSACQRYLGNKTQLIVAHRLSTILDCDRIVWLDHGRIVMEDKPEIVLKQFQSEEILP